MRKKLDHVAAYPGKLNVRVYYPYDREPRVMRTTGVSRTYEGPAPCHFEWELVDPETGVQEWLPGWYVVSRV